MVRGIPKDCGSVWPTSDRNDSCFFLTLCEGLLQLFGDKDALAGHFKAVVGNLVDMMELAGCTTSVDLADATHLELVLAAIDYIQVRVVVLPAYGRRAGPDGRMAFQLTKDSFFRELGSARAPASKVVYMLYHGDGRSAHGHYTLLSRAQLSE